MSSDGTQSIIQCPECQTKLRLRSAPTPGKKIICPKCKAPFVIGEEEVPVAEFAMPETKKTPPPPEEDFDEEERPKKPKLKKKKGKGASSNLGLIIGLSIGGLLLVGGLIFGVMFLLNSGLMGSKHESLIQNLISNMDELAQVLESVNDENSAVAAAPKIASIAAKMSDLRRSMKDLKIAKVEDDRLKKKYEEKLKSVAIRLSAAGMKAGMAGGRVPAFRDALMKMQSPGF